MLRLTSIEVLEISTRKHVHSQLKSAFVYRSNLVFTQTKAEDQNVEDQNVTVRLDKGYEAGRIDSKEITRGAFGT
jgi:hypothetical protein